MKTHHWVGKTPKPDKFWGFIYLITNNISGRKYIGRKQYHFERMIKVAGRSRRKKTILPSGWEYYTGSCKELNKDIKKFGKENFTFTILYQCSSRSMLNYMEAKVQFQLDVLLGTLEGTEIPIYYNRQILGSIKFIPRGYYE